MVSKSKIKLIKSLGRKKTRMETGLFLAEGNKVVESILGHFVCNTLIAEKDWIEKHPYPQAKEIIEAGPEEIKKASLLKNPQEVLGLFCIPDETFDKNIPKTELTLMLDDIQDPGNLGTIVRLSAWFGIGNILCSPDTADLYNPKTVQATMGALGRVKVNYTPLEKILKEASQLGITVYGTFLDGKNIYREELGSSGILIMGNEGKGISGNIAQYVNKKLFLPSFPQGNKNAESLNVAVATAVAAAEFRRREYFSPAC